MTEIQTHTLEVPGAVVAYDVRPVAGSAYPTLLMVGSPMEASGFADLAARFHDRTVVTYDPRGMGRSAKDDPESESTPDEHADDLYRVISAVGVPVDVFASSGGAVNALVLVARYPELVRVLVPHEFGMPAEDDGRRDDPLLGQNLISCTYYEHDFDALRSAKTRIVVAVGAESEGELAYRGGIAVAGHLSVEPVTFPSHHRGFIGEDPLMKGDPDAFAEALRTAIQQG